MTWPTLADSDFIVLYRFAISLALGLLIGLERERNPAARAGLRTFAITSLLGTLSAMLAQSAGSPLVMVAAMLGVAAFITGAYWRNKEADPGTTTQVALLLCFGLGAMVWYGEEALAIMLAIVTTALLYFKTELEGISRNLTRRDLVSILQFAVVSFIVLPLLPNTNYGPYHTLNPYQIWLMVVLISGVSLAGYIALRIFGTRHGALLLGLFGGLVSSTATTLIYARQSRVQSEITPLAASVIILANLVVILRLAVLVGILAPRLLLDVSIALAPGLILGLGVALWQWRHSHTQQALTAPDIKNPTELRVALGFAVFYAVVLYAGAWLSQLAGSQGLYALAAVSGLMDVDAITLSVLRLHALGQALAPTVTGAIVLAILSNLAFKISLLTVVGGRQLALRCLPAFAAIAFGCHLFFY